jgi:hypothetical protein
MVYPHLSKGLPVNKATALVIPALLVFSLAGCVAGGTPGGTPGDGSTDAGGDGGTAGGSTSCLVGPTWSVNVDDIGNQIGETLSSNGMNVVSSEATGSEQFTFNADGTVTTDIDVTYDITVDMDSGLAMTITQKHTGTPGGNFAVDGSTVTFSGWDSSGYNVENTVSINGTSTDMAIPMDNADFGNTPMTIECTSAGITSTIEGAPFEWHWTR